MLWVATISPLQSHYCGLLWTSYGPLWSHQYGPPRFHHYGPNAMVHYGLTTMLPPLGFTMVLLLCSHWYGLLWTTAMGHCHTFCGLLWCTMGCYDLLLAHHYVPLWSHCYGPLQWVSARGAMVCCCCPHT